MQIWCLLPDIDTFIQIDEDALHSVLYDLEKL